MSISTKKGHLSPEYAVLGFLYCEPMHGYDLHRKLGADLGYVWHVSQSEAYAILKRLEAQGHLAAEAIPQQKLPPRQLLRITPAGRERFAAWLHTPSGGSARAIRMEFLTRLYFTQRTEPENTPSLFDLQRAEIEKHIQRLETAQHALPPNQIFNRMSLDMRIRQLHLTHTWLTDCQTEFATPPHTDLTGNSK